MRIFTNFITNLEFTDQFNLLDIDAKLVELIKNKKLMMKLNL